VLDVAVTRSRDIATDVTFTVPEVPGRDPDTSTMAPPPMVPGGRTMGGWVVGGGGGRRTRHGKDT
jgi:hypothetical protein